MYTQRERKSETDFGKSVQMASTLLRSLGLRVARMQTEVQIANETHAWITIFLNSESYLTKKKKIQEHERTDLGILL